MNLANTPASAAQDRPFGGVATQRAAAAPLRVLLADDCPMSRKLVTALLARWGIVPTLACDGAQAVDVAERQDFDIVFMDILMPVMDGVAATGKIRKAERETPARAPVPIVAYTSLDLGADPAQLRRVGLTDVLAKPCSPSSLQSCLALHCPDRFRTRP